MSADSPDEKFSPGEELAHSLTHGVGLLLGIAALVLMVVFTAQRGSALRVVSCTVYGATLCRKCQAEKSKRKFGRFRGAGFRGSTRCPCDSLLPLEP